MLYKYFDSLRMLKSLYNYPLSYKGIVINAGRHLVENFTLVSLILNCIFDKKLAVFHLNNDIVVYFVAKYLLYL